MSEIKKDLIKLSENDTYKATGNDYVITEDHTHADILRFIISDLGSAKDVSFLLLSMD